MNNFLLEQQDKANRDLESTIAQSRTEDRILWDKLITIVLTILGFSLTLFSTEFLSKKITSSYSKHFLLTSWIFYVITIIIGFFLLKKETVFQKNESLRKVLYALDSSELQDDNLKIKQDKKDQWIALQILHAKRSGPIDYWSKTAIDTYEKSKKSLNSYKAINHPEKFYSFSHYKLIIWSEKIFYSTIIIATISLMVSVLILLF